MTPEDEIAKERRLRRLYALRDASLRGYTRERERGRFWQAMAQEVHDRWGRGRDDFALYGGILDRSRARSILDLGCGSGRLFPLYREKNIGDVLGVDISRRALQIADRDFPEFQTILAPLEQLELERHFDLAISNQVLQHVPRETIADVVEKIATACSSVFVNDLGVQEDRSETPYMFAHDYEELFGPHGFTVSERHAFGGNASGLLFAKQAPLRSRA